MSAASQSAPLPTIGGVGIGRPLALIIGFFAALIFIGLAHLVLQQDGKLAVMFFDNRTNTSPPYPFTIQNATWIVFFVGLTELAWVMTSAALQRRQLAMKVLPEEDDIMFDAKALNSIARRIARQDRGYHLQQVILRSIWQFLSTGSISQSTEVMNVSLELCDRSVDQNYTLSRYIIWLIPTLGFIGTVLGISEALSSLNVTGGREAMAESLKPALKNIGLAFNTTLVSLLLSAILVFFSQIAEGFENETTKRIGQYCVDHLINKIFHDEQE